MRFTAAIDGPAAAGKGTINKAVAADFGFAHLDTGLLYRAVWVQALGGDNPVEAAGQLGPNDFAQSDLYTPEGAKMASRVSMMSDERSALADFQRAFAARDGVLCWMGAILVR